jgi:hypothetical protein
VEKSSPGEVGLDVPEEVEGQLARLLLPCHMLTVLGLPQLVREGHCQVVLADVLLHLCIARVASCHKDCKAAMHELRNDSQCMLYKQKKRKAA